MRPSNVPVEQESKIGRPEVAHPNGACPLLCSLGRNMLNNAKEHRMPYIAVLAITLLMVAGSVVYVMTGQHSRKSR